MNRGNVICLILTLFIFGFTPFANAKGKSKVPVKTKAKVVKAAAKRATASVPSNNKIAKERMTAALTSVMPAQGRAPSGLDANSTLEVRGQARTLSMMLVLKKSKDEISFIKVRKDFKPEIQTTEF